MPKLTGTAISSAMSGGDQGAVDRHQRAEFLGHRIPFVTEEESEAEPLIAGQLPIKSEIEDADKHRKHQKGEQPRGVAKHQVIQMLLA